MTRALRDLQAEILEPGARWSPGPCPEDASWRGSGSTGAAGNPAFGMAGGVELHFLGL